MDTGRFFSELDSLFASGNQTGKIEDFLKNSLSTAEREGDLTSAVSICNEMGGFYRVRGLYSPGEDAFNKALKYISEIKMDGTSGHATTLLNLATLLTHKGDVEKAGELFQKASDILESIGGNQSYVAAAVQNNIASMCIQTGEYSNGLRHTEKALALLEGASDRGDERGVTYTIAAQLLMKENNISGAEEKLKMAADEFATDSQTSPVHRATMEHCLAELLIKKEDYKNAADACGRGIAFLESSAVRSPAMEALKKRRDFCISNMPEEESVTG